jgi:hypothetical protein
MNKTQTNHYRMLLGLQGFLNENSPVWSTIPRIVTYKNDLDEIILHLGEKTGQSKEGVSVTGKKEKLKQQTAEKVSVVSGILTAFAHEQDDMDMATKVKLSKSEILKMREVDIDAYIKSIISIAKENLLELADFGLSEALLTEIESLVDEFNGLIGKPRTLLNKKYQSLGEVEQLINEGNQLLKNKLDKLMLMFRESNPTYYDGYQRARVIVDR